jgi:hypothetical protein
MLIALVAILASAETYSYLKFTKTNGTTATYSTESLKLTYDASNVYVTNAETSATIALAEVQNMYFSNEPASAFMLGDVNDDGDVNVSDVTALIAYILGNEVDPFVLEAANCDGDSQGNINVSDVTALIHFILTQEW